MSKPQAVMLLNPSSCALAIMRRYHVPGTASVEKSNRRRPARFKVDQLLIQDTPDFTVWISVNPIEREKPRKVTVSICGALLSSAIVDAGDLCCGSVVFTATSM
jgi:hypothetical protein